MKDTKTSKRLLLLSPLVLIILFLSSFATIFSSKNINKNLTSNIPAYNIDAKGIYYGQSPYDDGVYDSTTEDGSDPYDGYKNYGRTAVVLTDEDGYDHLYMWGDNTYGQLGQGETSYSDLESSTKPLDGEFVTFKDPDGNVVDDYIIQDVSMSTTSTAAIVTYDGEDHLYMWGDTASGQLGLGQNTDSYTDIVVPMNSGAPNRGAELSTSPKIVNTYPEGHIVDIELSNSLYEGDNFGAELIKYGRGDVISDKNETLLTWGDNDVGQLGLGYTSDYIGAPQPVYTYPGADAFPIIDEYTVGGESIGVIVDGASTTSGSDEIYTWGGNSKGQLGTGDYTDASSAQNVDLSSDLMGDVQSYDHIEMTNSSTLIVANSSEGKQYVYTTGNNDHGELGISSNISGVNTFSEVTQYQDGENVVEITAGTDSYSGYINQNGENVFYGWGNNKNNQLGVSNDQSELTYLNAPTETKIKYYDQENETIVSYKIEAGNAALITYIDQGGGDGYYVFYGWGDNSIRAANPFDKDNNIETAKPVLLFGVDTYIDTSLQDAELVSTTSTTFTVNLRIYDPNNNFDPNAVSFYNGKTELDYVYIGTSGTQSLGTEVYTYEIINLNPDTTYNMLYVTLSDQGSMMELGFRVNTLPYNMIEIADISLQSSTISSATFAMKLKLNTSSIEDLISVHYTLTDDETELSTDGIIYSNQLEYNASEDIYEFTIDGLDEGHYYTLSNVYLELYNIEHTGIVFSPATLVGDENLNFATAFNQSTIDAVDFNLDSITASSVEFSVNYANLGSYDPSDLKLSYIENAGFDNSQIYTEVSPTLVSQDQSAGDSTYIYRLEGLNGRSSYSAFKFYMPTTYDTDGSPIYDYETPDFNSDVTIVTSTSGSIIDADYGVRVDEVHAKSTDISVKFEDLETKPELIQISYYENGEYVSPVDNGTDLSYLGYDEVNDVYKYKVEDLKANTSYTDAELYEPQGAISSTKAWSFEYDYGSPLYTSSSNFDLRTNLFWLWISVASLLIILMLIITNLMLSRVQQIVEEEYVNSEK